MKYLLILLVFCGLSFGQVVRIDPTWGFVYPQSPSPWSARTLGTNPGAKVWLCNDKSFPVCDSLTTTYSDNTGATVCLPNQFLGPQQATAIGSNVCTGTAGSDGTFGFWVSPAATYWYSFQLPGAQLPMGPYPITAPGLGGGSGGGLNPPVAGSGILKGAPSSTVTTIATGADLVALLTYTPAAVGNCSAGSYVSSTSTSGVLCGTPASGGLNPPSAGTGVLKGATGSFSTSVAAYSVDLQAPISYTVSYGAYSNLSAATTGCSLLSTQCIIQLPFGYTISDTIGGFATDFTTPDQALYPSTQIFQDDRRGRASFYANSLFYSYSNQNSTVNSASVISIPVQQSAFNSFIQNKFTILEAGHLDSGNASNYQFYNENIYATTPGQFIGHGLNVSASTYGDHLTFSTGIFNMGGTCYSDYCEGDEQGDFLIAPGVQFNGTQEFSTVGASAGTHLHSVLTTNVNASFAPLGTHRWLVDSSVGGTGNTVTNWSCQEFGPNPCVATFGTAVTASSAIGTVASAIVFPSFNISTVTAGTPIIVTTTTTNSFTTGQQIEIVGVAGIPSANGLWTITAVNGTQFALNSSSGIGTFTTVSGAAPPTAKAASYLVSVAPAMTTGAVANFSTSQLACVADYNDEPEMIYPSTVGATTITLLFHNPHASNFIVATGGLCGKVIEANADALTQASFPELTGRYSGVNIVGTIHTKTFMVISSTTSTAQVAVQGKGAWRSMNNNSGWSTANNAVTLWDAAKVLMVSTTPGQNAGAAAGFIGLADNQMIFTSGHTLTEFIGSAYQTSRGQDHEFIPTPNFTGAGGRFGSGERDGIMNGGDTEDDYVNLTSPLRYYPLGGTYVPPYGIRLQGAHTLNHWDFVGGTYDDFMVGCPIDGCVHNAHPVLHINESSGSFAITGATNATPIVIQTATATGLSAGQSVSIYGVTGNTNANGYWTATPVDSTHFAIYNAIGNPYPVPGNGAYMSGGTAVNNNCYDDIGIDEVDQHFYYTYNCGANAGQLNGTGGGGTVNTPASSGVYTITGTSTGAAVPINTATRIVLTLTCSANNTATVSGPCVSAQGAVVTGSYVRTVSGTTDTLRQADWNGWVYYTSSSAVAVAIPQPGSGNNFEATYTARLTASSGTVTFTPSGGALINGASSMTLTNASCVLYDTGTAYYCK